MKTKAGTLCKEGESVGGDRERGSGVEGGCVNHANEKEWKKPTLKTVSKFQRKTRRKTCDIIMRSYWTRVSFDFILLFFFSTSFLPIFLWFICFLLFLVVDWKLSNGLLSARNWILCVFRGSIGCLSYCFFFFISSCFWRIQLTWSSFLRYIFPRLGEHYCKFRSKNASGVLKATEILNFSSSFFFRPAGTIFKLCGTTTNFCL